MTNTALDWPPPAGPDDYGLPPDGPPLPHQSTDFSIVPLTIAQWDARDLPPADRLLGEGLTTTSRVILVAPTGIGKTNFAMALAIHMAAGEDFLHWRAQRKARVVFIDGEMSRRLLKQRIRESCERLGQRPDSLFFLSKEDVAGFPPLNTPAGHAAIKDLIRHLGGVDFVFFDNIMSLIIANHRETDGWQQVQPLVAYLTASSIGQLWVHHTGHDPTKGYGDKSREWAMDTVVHLTEEKRPDTDVSFSIEFKKARERTPETRADFATVAVALVNDDWRCDAANGTHKGHIQPLAGKFLDALKNALAGEGAAKFQGRPAATFDAWRAECKTLGLFDGASSEKSANSLFGNNKRALIFANRIACHDPLAWVL
jgi:hypothetical protein